MLATDQCKNCGEEFGDHSFVVGSSIQWRCRHKLQDNGYGYFIGGDPRRFFPDLECCSAVEIENHRIACEAWIESEASGVVPEPLRSHAPFGIGIYTCELDQYWEAREYDNADEIQDLVIDLTGETLDAGFEMLAEDDDGDDLEFFHYSSMPMAAM